ncbi:telomere stability and silencing-domain-containing protein [Hyaloraphidium curvatum]|nr:telomere stability and silencing-domain-containing protein [Hyaloraphidium curvatum]
MSSAEMSCAGTRPSLLITRSHPPWSRSNRTDMGCPPSDAPLGVYVRVPGLAARLHYCAGERAAGAATVLDLKEWLAGQIDVPTAEQRIVTASGWDLADEDLLAGQSACVALPGPASGDAGSPLLLSLAFRLRGGKGGFGSNLRALGGRMSSQKTDNKDACRDLQGRRMKTVNEAKKMAEYAEQEEERKRKEKERIEKKIAEGLKEPEAKKIRFDDSQFFADHEKAREDVKDAVAKGLKKATSAANAKPKTAPATVKPARAIWDDDGDDSEDESDNGHSSASGEKVENKVVNSGVKRKAVEVA